MALLKEVNGKAPKWGDNCYLAENAALVGDITMGDDCSGPCYGQMWTPFAWAAA